ncbi:VOC family protein [Haloplanus halophilus]|uniref:VOC family protein n=1 Tax=Haloplanus halophilus TaxID=2949993 RepID=UPI002112C4D4|nr:VOC family protein [Haloplanus sp. GDY1]
MTGSIGRVGLWVTDLDRMVEFYGDVIGLETLVRDGDRAVLGVDDPLLVLAAAPDRPARGVDETGLFHTAFRVPSRAALGDALGRIERNWRLDGASDHRVSEALYLSDPEDNGIEMYRDRPRSAWPTTDDGRVEMDTLPLGLDPLREAAGGADRCPPGTDVGHVHLEVSSLDAARSFYADGLGLRVRQSMPGALFLAADDYHHHVGCNVWNGRSKPPEGRGLAWIELALDDAEAVASRVGGAPTNRAGEVEATDPDGITIRLRRA